jgi:hypothetical protein
MTISVLFAMDVPLINEIASKPLPSGGLSYFVPSHPLGAGNWLMPGRVEIYEAPAINAYSILVGMIISPYTKLHMGNFVGSRPLPHKISNRLHMSVDR